MDLWISSTTTQTRGPNLKIYCPACGGQDVAATTAETTEENKLFWLIPFFTAHFTTVACGACGKTFRTGVDAGQLAQLDPQDISSHLAASVPFLARFCVIVSLVMGLVPFVGLVFSLIGVACTVKRRTGWRTAAFIGLFLSLASTCVLIVGMAMNK